MTSEPSIIELLKNNWVPFGGWPEFYGKEIGEEMQAKAREIAGNAFERFVAGRNGMWVEIGMADRVFCHESAYRLRPAYEEEPEIVECEIQKCIVNGLLYDTDGLLSIMEAPNDPDFIGFKAHGWIWGCLYRNKKDPSMVHYMIKEHDLPLYDVLSMVGGKVLFKRLK